MPLKGAQEFVEDLIRAVSPLEKTAIILKECTPTASFDFNWVVACGPLPHDMHVRWESAVIELKRQHARLDWEGVSEREGNVRIVARWVSSE
jgi:hypothetical protein